MRHSVRTCPGHTGFSGDVSMNKEVKMTRAAREKAEEAALNRILCWVVGGSVLEFLLMLLNRYWVHYGPTTSWIHRILTVVVPVLAFAGLAGTVAGALWWRRARKDGKSVNLPGTLTLLALGISAGCFGAWLIGESGILLMSRFTPVAVLLALIYHLYQREFFVIAAQGALAIFGVWICDRGLGGLKTAWCWIYVAGAAVLILVCAILCRKAQTAEGNLEWKGNKTRLFPKDANYALVYAGAVVALAVLICALFSLPAMILYAVLVAWLLVMAVFYTVKMM